MQQEEKARLKYRILLLRIDEGSLDIHFQKQWIFLQNNLEEFFPLSNSSQAAGSNDLSNSEVLPEFLTADFL